MSMYGRHEDCRQSRTAPIGDGVVESCLHGCSGDPGDDAWDEESRLPEGRRQPEAAGLGKVLNVAVADHALHRQVIGETLAEVWSGVGKVLLNPHVGTVGAEEGPKGVQELVGSLDSHGRAAVRSVNRLEHGREADSAATAFTASSTSPPGTMAEPGTARPPRRWASRCAALSVSRRVTSGRWNGRPRFSARYAKRSTTVHDPRVHMHQCCPRRSVYKTRCSYASGFSMFSAIRAASSSGDSFVRRRKGERTRPTRTHAAAMSSASW